MSDDPLAQFRRTPPAPPAGPKAKEPDEYRAFAGKDKTLYLEIRRAMAPSRSPRNNILLDVTFDGPYGTNFVLLYTTMSVMVRGRNLQEVVFAVQNYMATYIQEFDPDRWSQPKNDKAPFIESIEVKMHGSSADVPEDQQTKH